MPAPRHASSAGPPDRVDVEDVTVADTGDVQTDLRERLLDATWHLMTRPAPKVPVTLTRVCGAADCTPHAVFQHFDSLDHLVRDTSIRAFTEWAHDIESGVGATEDPLERICRRGAEYVRWGVQHPLAYQALFGAEPTIAARPGFGYAELLADVAMVNGLAPDDPALPALGLAHWAGVHGLTMLSIADPSIPEDVLMVAYRHLCSSLYPSVADFDRPNE